MARHVVGTVGSVPPGSTRSVEVEGRPVAIFNADGRLYALRDTCPHQGAPLSKGVVMSWAGSSDPGCYELDRSRKLVRCPWHGWEYELATGRSWYAPDHDRVRAFDVSVERGEALLPRVEQAEDGRLPGPFVAETVTITIEDDYIVVEV